MKFLKSFYKKRFVKFLSVFLASVLVISSVFFVYQSFKPDKADAAPALDVSVSCPDTLLGSNTTCRVTIANVGPDRGYGLSLTGTFSSSLADPDGQVSIVNNPDYPYSSHTINPATGDTTVDWVDIRDLASGEDFNFDIEVNFDETTGWDVTDILTTQIDAVIYEVPNLTLPAYGTDTDTSTIYPIRLTKSFNQSTAQQQATGAVNSFSVSFTTENNSINPTEIPELRDTIPDGLEFVPDNDPSTACSIAPTTATRNADESWDLVWQNYDGDSDGTFNASESVTINCGVYVRYDYEQTGSPVADDTVFSNTVEADFSYPAGGPYVLSDTATDSDEVTATFLTINKTDDEGDFGTDSDNTIQYTIAYSGSEYYTHNTIQFTDVLGDGQIFCTAAGFGYDPLDADPNPVSVPDCTQAPSLTPTTVTENSPSTGQITAIFDIAALGTDAAGSFIFESVVNQSYSGHGGSDIVAGDVLGNSVDMTYNYNDATPSGTNNGSDSESSSSSTPSVRPSIDKTVCHPDLTGDPATCQDADYTDTPVNLVVGDNVSFRTQFTGTTNIDMKDIAVTDWVPSGFTVDTISENPGGSCVSSPDGNFPGGDPNAEITGTAFGLDYIKWDLGDTVTGSVWCAQIDMSVDNDPGNQDGVLKSNLFKMEGANVVDDAYSERDGIDLNIEDPNLVLTKTATTVPSPLLPGSTVEYTVAIENTSGGIAEDVLFLDTIADGMRGTTPNITAIDLNGTPLVENTDYKITPAYNSTTGEWHVDFNDTSVPAVETSIPAGETLIIVYEVVVDSGVGAGADLTNIASTSYNTQDDGSGRVTDLTTDPADDNTDDEIISLAPVTTTKSVSPTSPISVGNTLTYTIDVTVPQGMYVYWPEIVDTLNRDGVVYQTGTAALADISGTPPTSASFDASTNPDPIISGGGSNTILTWYLNNYIDNSGQATDYVFRLTFDVMYDGLEDDSSWEFFLPTSDDRVRNSADFDWNNISAGSRQTNETASTGNVYSNVDQPLLALAKSVTSSGPYYSGSSVDYEVVITNNGWSTAYDIYWDDDLPVHLGSPSLTSVTHSSSGLLTSGVDYQENFGIDPIEIDFDGGTSDTNLDPGETITIVYSAVVAGDVGSGAEITNIADVDWSSLDGTPAGSRRYDDSAEEAGYTDDTDSETINIAEASIDKTITSPNPAEATMGDIINYRARVTVPAETVLYSPYVRDIITTDGMTYVGGSAVITPISGNPDAGAVLAGGTPTLDYNNPNPGATAQYDFTADIDNANPGSPNGDTNYIFDLTYSMLVTGLDDSSNWIWDPSVLSNSTNNTATLSWNDGVTDRSDNDGASLDIEQPYLVTDKNFNVHSGDGGDIATSTVIVTNNGESTAYEYDSGFDFIDTVPDGFINTSLTSITHSSNGLLADPADYSATISGNDLQVEYNSSNTDLDPGESLTFVYTLQVDPLIGAGTSLTNAADVDYSSQNGVVSGQRVYDDSDPLEGTADEDSDTFIVNNASITKTLDAPSAEATIGDTFDYTVTIDVPSNTTLYNSVLSDTVPDGLTVLSTSESPSIGSVSYSEQSDGTTPVTWTIGDVTSPPNSQLILTISVRVDNTYFDGTPLDGLPVGVDGDAQDVINNTGNIYWEDADTGGGGHNENESESFTVTEPNLTITKNAVPDTAGAGQTVQYTVVMTNNGTSTAYDLDWQDTIPSELFDAGTSPTLVSVTHSSIGALSDPDDFSSSFGVNPTTIDFHGTSTDPNISPTESLTIVYNAIIEGGVTYGQTLTNTTQVNNYSTQDGTDPNERESGPVNTTEDVTAQAPIFVTEKTVIGDSTPQVGDTVTYQYVVNNVGNADSINVDVTDTLPSPGFSYIDGTTSASWSGGGSSTANPVGAPGPGLSWDFNANINTGESLTLAFDVLVEAGASLGAHTNTASATGEDTEGSAVPADGGGPDTDPDDTDTADIFVSNPEVSITKSLASGQDQYVQVGEAIQYEVEITNTGNTRIDVLTLQDNYDTTYITYVNSSPASDDNTDDGAINWSDITSALGDLDPGSSHTVTMNFTAASEQVNITNTATVENAIDENTDTAPTVNDNDTLLSITNPEVTVTKTLAPGQDLFVALGDTVTYNINIENTGDTVLELLPLEDIYDTGIYTYTGSTPSSDDDINDGVINWTDLTITEGNINPGSSIDIQVTFTAIATGTALNIAEVSGAIDINTDTAPDSSDNDNTLTITNPNLSIDKHLSAGQDAIVPIGGTVAYDIDITNVGDTAIEVLPLSDTYEDSYLSYVGSSPASDDNIDDGQIDWADLTVIFGDLNPTDTITVTVEFTAIDDKDNVQNIARIENAEDENGLNPPAIQDTDNEMIITSPEITIEKTLSDGQDEHVQINEEVSYDLTVTNTGSTLIDVLPLNDTYDMNYLSYIGSNPLSDDNLDDGSIDWGDITATLGDLAVGGSHTVNVTFEAVSLGLEITDTGIVENAIDENGHTVPTDSDEDNILSITDPTISIDKRMVEGQSANVQVGNKVEYEIIITNTGDTELDVIALSDAYDTEYLEYAEASISPDSSENNGLINWSDLTVSEGNLAAGEDMRITVTFLVVAVGTEIPNTARVEEAVDINRDSAEQVEDTDLTLGSFIESDVIIEKSADPLPETPVFPGDTITYILNYRNDSELDLNNITITDVIAETIEYAGNLTLNNEPLTDGNDSDTGNYSSENRTVMVMLDQLLANSSGTITFQVTVREVEYSRPGLQNQATISSEETGSIDSNIVVHPVDPVDIFKTGEDINGGMLVPGDEILWKISVVNIGLIEASGVIVTDTIPENTEYVGGSMTGRGADEGGVPNLAWNVGTLQVDEEMELTFRSRVNDGVAAGTEIRNQATVNSDQSEPRTSDNPQTTDMGDATVMLAETGKDEDLKIIIALFGLVVGMAIIGFARKIKPAKKNN